MFDRMRSHKIEAMSQMWASSRNVHLVMRLGRKGHSAAPKGMTNAFRYAL